MQQAFKLCCRRCITYDSMARSFCCCRATERQVASPRLRPKAADRRAHCTAMNCPVSRSRRRRSA